MRTAQVGYQRQDKDKASDDEEYEKFVHDAQFRIQILKQVRTQESLLISAPIKKLFLISARIEPLSSSQPP